MILRLTQLFSSRLLEWLDAYKHGGLLLIGVGITLIFFLQLLRRVVSKIEFRNLAAASLGILAGLDVLPAGHQFIVSGSPSNIAASPAHRSKSGNLFRRHRRRIQNGHAE